MDKKILTIRNTTCTGCSACFNICPSDAIEMRFDEKGFYKPTINEDKCINCMQCDKTCPVINHQKTKNQTKSMYAMWANDDIRLASSSGGAFTVFAEEVLQNDGVVFGAAWGDDFTVIHKAIDSKEQLPELQRSKYLQSYVGLSFRMTLDFLKNGKQVLFVGTPCQIAGLITYLDKKKVDMSALITVDLFCYMVPPYYLFKKYLEDNFGKNIENFTFRIKDNNMYVSHFFEYKMKNEEPKRAYYMSPWFKAYFQRMYECDACEQCLYQTEDRVGDISIGDFWGIENHDKTWNDGKGTSMLVVNTKRGARFLNECKKRCKRLEQVPLDWIREGQSNGKKKHPNQQYFYDLLKAGVHYNKAVDMALSGNKFDIGIPCVQVYQNYGSAFTNFAFYSLLKDHGKSVLLINQPQSSVISPLAPHNFICWPYGFDETAKPFAKKSDMAALNKVCSRFVVGSDQLFNYEIYKQIDGFVKLDWVDDAHDKLAYATSFGVNAILGNAEEKEDFKRCIRRFKHISVREDSGVSLVRNNFNISAVAVLDPVFLCHKKHYVDMLTPFNKFAPKDSVFCYILDPEKDKEQIINHVSSSLNRSYFAVSDMWRSVEQLKELWNIKTATNIKNEVWLSSIYNSSFVITDSFHGLCFAIIFNKPFIVLHNKMRGNERFISLLEKLNLENRLIPGDSKADVIDALLNQKIDWDNVNKTIAKEIDYSYHWFKNNIL